MTWSRLWWGPQGAQGMCWERSQDKKGTREKLCVFNDSWISSLDPTFKHPSLPLHQNPILLSQGPNQVHNRAISNSWKEDEPSKPFHMPLWEVSIFWTLPPFTVCSLCLAFPQHGVCDVHPGGVWCIGFSLDVKFPLQEGDTVFPFSRRRAFGLLPVLGWSEELCYKLYGRVSL